MFSHCCCTDHGFSSVLVLSLGNVTTSPAAVSGANVTVSKGGAGRSGGGFPGAAARCQRSAPGGGGGVQQGQQELRARGRGPREAGGRAGPGQSVRGV